MIDLRKTGSIHVITLNDGPNLIGPAWQRRMLEVLDAVAADCEGEAGLVLTGEGKFFSNGLDVEAITKLQGDDLAEFGSRMVQIIGRLVVAPVPTAAVLNGHAFAAGAFLALACDYRWMREDRGWFCISEVDAGVPIGAPMMKLLTSKVAPSVARDAVLSGKRYPADEAIAAGLVDAKAPADELLERAIAALAPLAAKQRRIFKTLKGTLHEELAQAFGVGRSERKG